MKEIALTQGQFALVDDEDYSFLNRWKWRTHKGQYTNYACRTVHVYGKDQHIFMHKLIMGVFDPSVDVDHIDLNGLNNQKINLRNATKAQNLCNRRSKNNSSSKYKGVSLSRQKYKSSVYVCWQAEIQYNKKKYYLGHFKTEEEAALAYNKKAIEIQGEFAYLNKIA